MKQIFLKQNNFPRLLLIFAGWGADETMFRQYHPADSEVLLCYDYRDLAFDATALQGYGELNVVGWSMGVWAASHVVPALPLRPKQCIAINGTPFPIDERRGIPPRIFQGTLDGLTDISLHKFLRRMCGDTATFRRFLSVTPRRPLEELRDELCAIARLCGQLPTPSLQWTEAVVGRKDNIIPPANQLNAWAELHTPAKATDEPHYPEVTFTHYLQDLWTNN